MEFETRVRISIDQSIVWFDIPKVASTAIKAALAQDKVLRGREDGRSEWHNGVKWSEVRKEIKQNAFTFAFVRHPYDRILSTFKMFQKERFRPYGFPQKLEDFLELLNKPECPPPMHGHTMPMHGIMPIKHNKPDLDFLGRFETLKEDWKTLQNRFGWRDLPSKSSQVHVTEHHLKFTPNQAKIVAKYCKRDFEIFGYNPKDFVE